MPICGLCILSGICWICYLILEFFENFFNFFFFSEGRESPYFFAGRIMLVPVCVERFCSEIHYSKSQSDHSSAFQHLFSRSYWSFPNWSNQAAWSSPYPEGRRVWCCCLVWVFPQLLWFYFLKMVVFLFVRIEVSCRCYINLIQNQAFEI